MNTKNFYDKVYEIVKKIPYGKIASYSQIALITGHPDASRAVGYALHKIPLNSYKDIPWHRVINSKGKISIKNSFGAHILQRELLEAEGIIFDKSEKVDFKQFGWLKI